MRHLMLSAKYCYKNIILHGENWYVIILILKGE